ncbi:MAG TPA: GDSL-type esterase/lipase family protein [Puia sp.]|nr:GDSL-type esterase/lipase family protein [Puia sp.]
MKTKTIIFGLLLLTLPYSKTVAQSDSLSPHSGSLSPHSDSPQLPYSDYFTPRDGLHGFYTAVTKQKKATVAFLGGSITFNPGWREKVCTYLTARFPETDFHFIAAGIPSLGSLPHAFRVQQDVLDSGRIDLLFLETAVNDRVNGTDSLTQVRCLEGILRHVRKANPGGDIIMMAFADSDKIADYDRGIVPVEIANQDLVAGHYGLPSINLGKEVHDKIRNKEFDWKLDFRDLHPSPFGQELYFQNIKCLLDTCGKWYPDSSANGSSPFSSANASSPISSANGSSPPPLDNANLDNGRYAPVSQARHNNAWILHRDWQPADTAGTRPGFVHVPVLSGERPGAKLTLPFEGTAVGIAVVSGPDAGIVEYAIDNGPWRSVNLFTKWSNRLHLPWFILFGSGLPPGSHVLQLRIGQEKDPNSRGHACRIVHFLVNR